MGGQRRVDLAGAAHLVLADGVRHLQPEEAVFDDARRHLLGEAGLHLASEWWTAVIAPGQKV